MATSTVLNFNVGVMGHVDSGKTSLCKALSTVSSTACFDKNPQSKERGITLDLGFSSFQTEIPSHFHKAHETESETSAPKYESVQYTLVDCPGHASLIRTIIGGAQIIDLILLVVDVTKGFQTQTAECLVIGEITCQQMIVVLNKIDLMDDIKQIERIKKKIAKTLENTKFSGCSIVPVSACPGANDLETVNQKAPVDVEQLIDVIKSNTHVPKRDSSGPFIFSVDHCFLIRGQGTVMTGTVLSGCVAVNDSVEIPALKVTKKVKSLQMFKKPVSQAIQGDRLGMCVTQFDPECLERGLVCQPNSLPTMCAALISIEKIHFFKSSIQSKSKYHVTIGHETVMATIVLFQSCDSQMTVSPNYLFDYSLDYKYMNELSPSTEKSETGQCMFFALLNLEKPKICPRSSIVIGSKLDTDIHSNTCRIAFHGRLLDAITSTNYTVDWLPKLRVFKIKQKEGVVERGQNDDIVIVKNLFKKETNLDLFVGLKVQLSTGESGKIEGMFGKGGKVNVRISGDLSEDLKKYFAVSNKKRYKPSEDVEIGKELIKVYLSFKRYIYDQAKKIIQ